jgi:hypothetical protein
MKVTRFTIGCLLVLFVLAGCATLTGRNYGSFVPDRTLTANIKNFVMDKESNYYFSGPEASPTAIMGLKKKYVLNNALWKPILNRQQCLELLQCMVDSDAKQQVRSLFAYRMYTPDGEPIGEWYSEIWSRKRIVMGEGNSVVVYTPEQRPAGGEWITD